MESIGVGGADIMARSRGLVTFVRICPYLSSAHLWLLSACGFSLPALFFQWKEANSARSKVLGGL
jgi:hypothetical protein